MPPDDGGPVAASGLQGREHEGAHPPVRLVVGVGLQLQERLNDRNVPPKDGADQRRVACLAQTRAGLSMEGANQMPRPGSFGNRAGAV